MSEQKKSKQESIKLQSAHLRGNIKQELNDASSLEVSDEAYELLKFHGSYLGYDRDSATERKQQGLDKEHEFMIRLKMPGGQLTAAQYLALDTMSDKFANGTLRITTRETFQFHCILKPQFIPFVREINEELLSTIAGCGDITRNILTCPAPIKDNIHSVLEEATFMLARELAPKSKAYYEIFLDGEPISGYPFNPTPHAGPEVEPLYGDTYMPRKFKIAIGQPEDNCMDAMTNDLALLALFDGQELKGYNIALGGGLGMNHNMPKTYPRLATTVGFIPPQDLLAATEAVVRLQRDHGDRGDRKHARLKYVVQEKGEAWTRTTLEGYLGRKLDDPKTMPKFAVEEHMGWHPQGDGKWFLGLPIDSGRIADRGDEALRTGLRAVISQYQMPLRLTADQNIILCDIETGEKTSITNILRAHGVKLFEDITLMHRNFFACVSLPTCGKALAEAERVQVPLVEDIDKLLAQHNLLKENIAIRIAGCPNGCSRPYVGDIGIVGRMPGHYALFVGGDFEGTRLNEKIFDRIPFEQLPRILDPMLALFSKERNIGEGFGDFCHRVGVASVKQAASDALAGEAWVK